MNYHLDDVVLSSTWFNFFNNDKFEKALDKILNYVYPKEIVKNLI